MPYKVNFYKACELKPTEVELFYQWFSSNC